MIQQTQTVMKTELTTTTGTVKGVSEVKDFIKECYEKHSNVFIVQMGGESGPIDYLQYTLLTKNEIRLYLSTVSAESVPK